MKLGHTNCLINLDRTNLSSNNAEIGVRLGQNLVVLLLRIPEGTGKSIWPVTLKDVTMVGPW